jgi:hypothetical protein
MPVVTRSQYLKYQQQAQYQETPVRVSCGNGKYRKVLINSNEAENPPNAPKKTKKNIREQPKGSVCRRLNFQEELKPEIYRGFNIANKLMRVKVDNFYSECEKYASEKSKLMEKRASAGANKSQLDGFSTDYLISLANSLLKYDLFTKFYQQDSSQECNNVLIESWGTMLTSIYSICFIRLADKTKIANFIDNLTIISSEIIPLVILFQPIISSDKFSGLGYCQKLLGVIMNKLLEFSNKGVIQAVVAIHKYFPEMVSVDCYPSLYPQTNNFNIKYTESLLDKTENQSIKTDWDNLKKLYE